MRVGDIIARFKFHWRLKLMLGFWVTLGFTTLYVLLQRFPVFGIVQVKASRLDRMIPFVPSAVYLYESLWLIMPLSFWLTHSMEELNHYAYGFILISMIGFGIFFLYPTANPRPGGLQHANDIYRALIRLDRELNAFPSLHAALAVYSGLCFDALFFTSRWRTRGRWLIWPWVLGIVASTLLTKQHALIDAMAGAILGYAGHASFWRPRKQGAGLPA